MFEKIQDNSKEAVMEERKTLLSELELTESDVKNIILAAESRSRMRSRKKFQDEAWMFIAANLPYSILEMTKQNKLLRLVMDTAYPAHREDSAQPESAPTQTKKSSDSQIDFEAKRQKYIDDSIERANR